MTVDDIIKTLRLEPHPEGGLFRETYRHKPEQGGRGASTAIYYLLRKGERSHWHRVVDADEIWHYYAGAPLQLLVADPGLPALPHFLGPDITNSQRPQIKVPANCWQSAESMGPWTLAGCTVSPAFEFSSFEMAPPAWRPPPSLKKARERRKR